MQEDEGVCTVELRLLKYFIAVAQEGNITKAADALHITQPTLSRQLTQLEEELDTVLLERGKKKVLLTDEGMLFFQKALEIVELTDRAEREFKNRNLIGGTVVIGAVESTASLIIPELIGNFVREYPNAAFELYSNYSNDVRERLDKGLIDVGLLMDSGDIEKYNYVRLPQKDVWGILARTDDPIAEKSEIHIRDIIKSPLIIPKRMSAKSEIENWIKDESKLNIFATYNLLSNAALLVEKGVGYAVCLSSSLIFRGSDVTRFLPFTPQKITGSIFVWKKNYIYSPIVTQFIKMIRENFEE